MYGLRLPCALSLMLSLLFGAAAAQTPNYLTQKEPQRLALVVGNFDYTSFEDLPGSRTDAEAMRDLLRDRLGFNVDYVPGADTFDAFTEIYLKAFAAKIREGDLVVFYFSGHGFAHGQTNYLVPTKAPPTIRPAQLDEAFLPESAIRAFLVKRNPGLVIVFLDACRTYAGVVSDNAPLFDTDTPLPPPSVAPAAGGGLLEPIGLGSDVIVGFAAAPGHPAVGYVTGHPSRYTRALLGSLDREDWEFHLVKRDVVYSVKSSTTPPQVPWFSDSVITEVFFKPTDFTRRQDLASWQAVLATGQRAKVAQYLEYHRVGPYAEAARRWLRDNPTDVHPTFSQVSPLQAELAWKAPAPAAAASVVLPRLPEGVGVARTLSLEGVDNVPRGSAEATTERLLQLHGEARLTKSTEAMTGAGSRVLARGIPLSITDSLGGVVRGYATPFLGGDRIAVLLKSNPQAEGYRVGTPFAEVTLRPPADGSAAVVDPRPLLAELNRLQARGRQVGWISISTPKVDQVRDQGLLSLRATQTKYLLGIAGIPEAKISTVEAYETGTDVRVRIYAF